MLVGDDDQLKVLDAPAVLRKPALQGVERGAHVRPAVEQRQRVVLDQVGVDGADLKRGGNGYAVDARFGGTRERGSLVHQEYPPWLGES